MKNVIKRDNRIVKFDGSLIAKAIKAASIGNGNVLSGKQIKTIATSVVKKINTIKGNNIAVEDIQDIVIKQIKTAGFSELSQKYNEYRMERNRIREGKTEIMKQIKKIGVQTDRDNANVGNNFSAKLLRIASESNK
jgi:ribonucleoside-triphosphate reductase